MEKTIEPLYPSIFERVATIIEQYGPELNAAAADRMYAGVKSDHRGRTVDKLGIIAGVSKNTISAVIKLLDANLPEIIIYHLKAGGMTINNGRYYLRLSPESQSIFTERLQKAAPVCSNAIYDKQSVHSLINRIFADLKINE